jgi:hypothetical protein
MSGQTRYVYGTRCEPPPPELTIEEQLVDLRRRVTALEHWKIDRQTAHNTLLSDIERLEYLLERRS